MFYRFPEKLYSLGARAFLAVLLCLVLHNPSPAANREVSWDIREDIGRLRKEAPSLSAFPDASGVIWMRHLNYSLRADGTLCRATRYLLFTGKDLDPLWSRKTFPMPSAEGAGLHVLEAALFDPLTGEREKPLAVAEREESGQRFIEITVPPEAERRIVAISVREDFPRRYFLDDMLFLALDLPVWEQKITVESPQDAELYWKGRGVADPERSGDRGIVRTSWTLTNQPAWEAQGLIEWEPPFLLFSLKKGFLHTLRSGEELASGVKGIQRPGRISTAPSLAAYVSDPKHLLSGCPWDWVRPAHLIFNRGKWTSWERTFLARSWFASLGWRAELFWKTTVPVTDDSPSTLGLLDYPVLELTPPQQGSSFFFIPGQASEFGRMPPGLFGATLYRLNEHNMVLKRDVSGSGADEHKLIQKWDLKLDESGLARGNLELIVLGEWTRVMGLERGSETEITRGIEELMDFRIPNLSLRYLSMRVLKSGCSVRFEVQAPLGIVSASDLLLRIPGALPRPLENLSALGNGGVLAFPFILEQKITIETPKGYRALPIYPLNEVHDRNIVLNGQMIHWPKKGRLEGRVKWVVRPVKNTDETSRQNLMRALTDYLRWVNSTVALRR